MNQPIPDNEPKLAAHAREMLRDLRRGTPKTEDYTSAFWESDVIPYRSLAQARLECLGELVSISLVYRGDSKGLRRYRYRIEFANGIFLLHLVLDAQNKVTVFSAEDVEWKTVSKPQSAKKR